MRGQPIFGLLVHRAAADLDLDPHILVVHDRRVERFIAVALRGRDIVFEAAGDHFPFAVDQAERGIAVGLGRSEEHTSELQSLMRISYAVFCLKTKAISESQIPTPPSLVAAMRR